VITVVCEMVIINGNYMMIDTFYQIYIILNVVRVSLY